MTPIELTPWLRAELVLRADVEAPEECCGLISRDSRGISLWGADNAAADPKIAFVIAPDNLLGMIRQMTARREELVGVYHSHPGGLPSPSPDDIAVAAQWPGLEWVIVSLGSCPNCDNGVTVVGGGSCDSCDGSGQLPGFWQGVLA